MGQEALNLVSVADSVYIAAPPLLVWGGVSQDHGSCEEDEGVEQYFDGRFKGSAEEGCAALKFIDKTLEHETVMRGGKWRATGRMAGSLLQS